MDAETLYNRSPVLLLIGASRRWQNKLQSAIANVTPAGIDVINDLAFDGSGPLVAQAESMAAPLAQLERRATAAGVPTI